MKLLTKTTLYFITVSLFIFFIGGIGFYILFSNIIEANVDAELNNQMHTIIMELSKTKKSPDSYDILSAEKINVKKTNIRKNTLNLNYSDTILYDKVKKIYYPYRKLQFYFKTNSDWYEISLHKSLIATDKLIERIALIMTTLVLVFISSIYFLNRYFFNRIWSDFFDTINKISKSDLNSLQTVKFNDSMIIEFNQLNEVLKKMNNRIQNDFVALKEFTGNMTHELQTPLSIIKSKAELLLQQDIKNENQLNLIQEIYQGTIRLSKLNQTLVLLTKIEKQQFVDSEAINLNNKINYHIENFESLFDAKKINYNTQFYNQLITQINSELTDILIINLLKNAIRHNNYNGNIDIEIKNNILKIRNTGTKQKLDRKSLFKRFSKQSKNKNSLGLGLAIIKKICDNYNIDIKYDFIDDMHEFTLIFSQ